MDRAGGAYRLDTVQPVDMFPTRRTSKWSPRCGVPEPGAWSRSLTLPDAQGSKPRHRAGVVQAPGVGSPEAV